MTAPNKRRKATVKGWVHPYSTLRGTVMLHTKKIHPAMLKATLIIQLKGKKK